MSLFNIYIDFSLNEDLFSLFNLIKFQENKNQSYRKLINIVYPNVNELIPNANS